jgi:hypothetical protein
MWSNIGWRMEVKGLTPHLYNLIMCLGGLDNQLGS